MSRLFRFCVIAAGLLVWPGLLLAGTTAATASPINHVVIIFQENHSFDETLGLLCKELTPLGTPRCSGATVGRLGDGTIIPLAAEPDIVPSMGHNGGGQIMAIDGGKMDGFQHVSGCAAPANACYVQYKPSQIPNLAALARKFVIADHTFEEATVPSWLGHEVLVSGTLDGFVTRPGRNPYPGTAGTTNTGWGCDSLKDDDWRSSPTVKSIAVPTCIPKPDGSGPYRPSPVPWVPTIMDRLDAAQISWRIYSGNSSPGIWAICPTFADCQYTAQKSKQLLAKAVLPAAAGTLPAVSFVMPTALNSQHNNTSMLVGDNWIASVVSAIENGPNWSSTAIFITYDDCGCFYDHVAPPAGSPLGIRVPMVIVSPYAKPAFTDSHTASFASMLAFIEHNWGLAPLNAADGNAYDFSNSFDYQQIPLPAATLTMHSISRAERLYLLAHPVDPDDPT